MRVAPIGACGRFGDGASRHHGGERMRLSASGCSPTRNGDGPNGSSQAPRTGESAAPGQLAPVITFSSSRLPREAAVRWFGMLGGVVPVRRPARPCGPVDIPSRSFLRRYVGKCAHGHHGGYETPAGGDGVGASGAPPRGRGAAGGAHLDHGAGVARVAGTAPQRAGGSSSRSPAGACSCSATATHCARQPWRRAWARRSSTVGGGGTSGHRAAAAPCWAGRPPRSRDAPVAEDRPEC